MKLHILGCGDAFGSGGRNQSGYLIASGDRLFLLDCGTTTLPAFKRAGFDPAALEAIFLSHLHGDHFGGIPFFFLEYLYLQPRTKPLHIAGPAGAEEKIRRLFETMYSSADGARELPPTEFHVLHPGQAAIVAGVRLLPFRVPHQVLETSLGLKVAHEGKEILFSGDSAWTDLFIEHARGVDLFLCECSFYDQETANHTSYVTLQKNLGALQCKQLVLTHLGAEMLARKNDLPVALAQDGMVIEV